MAHLQYISFKKKIYNDATPTNLIAAGDTVQVRLRNDCSSCGDHSGPNVGTTAVGCADLAVLDAHSAEILARSIPAPCVGDVVGLIVVDVKDDGRGFTYDRTVAAQNYRPEDIEMVMPDHDGVGCDPASGSGSVIP